MKLQITIKKMTVNIRGAFRALPKSLIQMIGSYPEAATGGVI